MPRALIVDLDGTLVDSTYHHAVAWYRAFRRNGITLPVWRIHRAIGMGADHLVPALVGRQVAATVGDAVREQWRRDFESLLPEVAPLDGARELLVAAGQLGVATVIASSSPPDLVGHYLDLLQARQLVRGWTTADDVTDTKPAPDLLEVALQRAGTSDGVTIGDAVWDVAAASRAGIPCLTVRTGGFGTEELERAGTARVYDDLRELTADLTRWIG